MKLKVQPLMVCEHEMGVEMTPPAKPGHAVRINIKKRGYFEFRVQDDGSLEVMAGPIYTLGVQPKYGNVVTLHLVKL